MTLAASLAFYMTLSLAPTLILFVAISSHLDSRLQQIFLVQVGDIVGSDAALTFNLIFQSAKAHPDFSSISGIGGILTSVLSAGLIFGQMRDALNNIFHAQPEPSQENPWWKTAWHFVKASIFQGGLALGFVFLMIVSLGISAFLSATALILDNPTLVSIMNIAISGLIYSGLYIMLFRFVPGRYLPWKQSLQGGVLTAVLFLIGKELIGIYLGQSAIGSAYGAAGSVVVLLVWVYYSALIVFIGAHTSFILNDKEALL